MKVKWTVYRISLTIAAAAMLGAVADGAGTGQISGTIQDQAGKPLAQAKVAILARLPASPSIPFEPFSAETTTDATGAFTVTGLPAGRFAVCPVAADTTLLPPCTWETEPVATLVAGQSVSMQPIQLRKGVDCHVRVNDPNGTRASMEGKVAGASLLLGVLTAGGMFVHIPQTAADGKGFDHHLTVPAGAKLTIMAYSPTYDLTDVNNTPIKKQTGLTQPISFSADQTQYTLVLNVK